MKKVLVTGATGFVGTALVQLLLKETSVECVHVLARRIPASLLTEPRLKIFQGSVLDANLLDDACRGVDHVFHLASQVIGKDDQDFHPTNVAGTRRLLEALPSKCGLIYLSSAGVYGYRRHQNSDEGTPLGPDTALARSRVEAEKLIHEFCQAHGRGALILRPRFVYGPGDRYLIPSLMKFFSRSPVRIDKGKSRLSVIHVHDLAKVMLQLAQGKSLLTPVVMNISDFRPIRISEIEAELARLRLITDRKSISIPNWWAQRLSAMADVLLPLAGKRLETSMATRVKFIGSDQFFASVHQSTILSGLRFMPFAEGMEESCEYYRDLLGNGTDRVKS